MNTGGVGGETGGEPPGWVGWGGVGFRVKWGPGRGAASARLKGSMLSGGPCRNGAAGALKALASAPSSSPRPPGPPRHPSPLHTPPPPVAPRPRPQQLQDPKDQRWGPARREVRAAAVLIAGQAHAGRGRQRQEGPARADRERPLPAGGPQLRALLGLEPWGLEPRRGGRVGGRAGWAGARLGHGGSRGP
jgi:hypothetical protein